MRLKIGLSLGNEKVRKVRKYASAVPDGQWIYGNFALRFSVISIEQTPLYTVYVCVAGEMLTMKQC